jgi:hypothetical protein
MGDQVEELESTARDEADAPYGIDLGLVVDVGAWRQREGVGHAAQGGEGGCDLGEAGADVGAGRGHGACTSGGVLVTCVGLRGGEAEAAFDPGQDRVPYPVRADLLGLDP